MKDVTPEDHEAMRQKMVENANAEAAAAKEEASKLGRMCQELSREKNSLAIENRFLRRIIEKLVDY